MTNARKHAEIIKAWADGAEIEARYEGAVSWTPLKTPHWTDNVEYRVKPKDDIVRRVHISIKDEMGDVVREEYVPANMELIFDGTTYNLKFARVLPLRGAIRNIADKSI